MLIDLLLYKPKWLVATTSVAPPCLKFHEDSDLEPEPMDPALVEDMTKVEHALRTPISIPWKSRFTMGPAVNVQFDGGSQGGEGSGGFVIYDTDG